LQRFHWTDLRQSKLKKTGIEILNVLFAEQLILIRFCMPDSNGVFMNIAEIRDDTVGVSQVAHLIASGSALMPKPVVDAVINHTILEAQIGGYEAHALQIDQLDGVYSSIAKLIGAHRDEIAILENATAAWCHVFYALPLKKGDRILTCEAEYAANYVAFLQRQKRDGIEIEVIPSDKNGAIDLDALEKAIDERVALISLTWIPTNGGLVNPAKEVGKIAKAHNIPYLLDGCQAIGQMPVDVKDLGCDFFSATGRKFLRGPRGIGFLFIKRHWFERLEPIVIDHFAAPWVDRNNYQLRTDARRFENWENSYALRAGLGAAAEYAMSIGLTEIQERSWRLANELRKKIEQIDNAHLRDIGAEKCAIVSFTIEGLIPREVVSRLRSKGINIGTSDPSSTRLDAEARGLPTVMRAAPHYYNTSEEIDLLIEALKSEAST